MLWRFFFLGYQESFVRAKENQLDNLMYFVARNKEWFDKRFIQPKCAVEVKESLDLDGYKFVKGEILLVVTGERTFQGENEKDGLKYLSFVDSVIPIEILENISQNESIKSLLENYFPVITNEEFYESYNRRIKK